MTTKFKHPPINELAIGAFFERPVAPLRAEHIGFYWARVRDEFPIISQQAPLSPPQLEPSAPVVNFAQMPRFWLEAKDGSTVVQLQQDACFFNWRRREAEYPHFDKVKSAFYENMRKYESFLQEEFGEDLPRIQLLDLTYINLINQNEYWSGLRDTGKVLPKFELATPDMVNGDFPDFHQAVIQKFPGGLVLNTTVRSARSRESTNAPVLVIEFRASGLLAADVRMEDWLEKAHLTINECFLRMTSLQIQRDFWQPV